MVRLFTSAYPEADPARRSEYAECLERNLANADISVVCIFVEGDCTLPESPKIESRPIADRPRYQDFFAWINEKASPADISIIANADIWFDGTLGAAADAIGANECFALSRWERGSVLYRNDSQDSWMIRGKMRAVRGDFPTGVPRCDNRILFELQDAGYRVLNPAFAIRSWHVHAGERGEYESENGNFVAPPYRYLWPHNLWSWPRTAVHNLTSSGARVTWRLDKRKIAASLPGRVAARAGRLLTAKPAP